MADWGLCATIKAPTDQVLAFVAHHLALGASHLWLFFDDPDDPAFDAVAGLSGVTATRCDAAYWQGVCKERPEAHQNRQSRNMRRVYKLGALQWIAHLDVDEFLHASEPVADALDALPRDRILLRMAPWEALHDPTLANDIFTARQFRAALKGPLHKDARVKAFGPYAELLPDGVLSHAAGKCFFQRGFDGLQPRLHGAFLDGERVKGGDFHTSLAVLHFHGEDPDRWLHNLQFRLTLGAYKFNPALQIHLQDATASEVDAFYHRVQNPPADVRLWLVDAGLLREADLCFRVQIAGLSGQLQGS